MSAVPTPLVAMRPDRPLRTALVALGLAVGLAALLRAIDGIPSLIRDEPRSMQRYESVEALERDTRTQLVLPFFFPDTLAWPPIEVVRAAGDGRPTRVTIADQRTGAARLIVAQCLDGGCDLGHRLMPPGRVADRRPVAIGGGTGTVTTREIDGFGPVTDLEWSQFGRHLWLRYAGPEDELLRIGRSMRRGLP